MTNFFRTLFRRKTSPAPAPRLAPPAAPAPVAAEADPFQELWDLIQDEGETCSCACSPEDQRLVESLIPRVMDHFSKNRPSPTSFPALAVRIIDLLNEPDVDMARLLKAISPDPAISINVLRVANSALYNRGGEVTEMRQAVMRIGLRGVGEIASGVAGRSLFDVALRVEYEIFGDRWHTLFLDTMAVAFGASQFAFEQDAGRPDQIFLAGMFHDIGKSLALRSLASLIIKGEVPPDLPGPVVDAVIERVHVDIGCAAHEIWGLSPRLRDICRSHHAPDVPAGPAALDIHVLRMSSGIHRLVKDPTDARRLDETRQSIQAMNLTRRGVKRLHNEMEHHIERVKVLFPA